DPDPDTDPASSPDPDPDTDPASSPDPGLEASAGRGGVAVPLTYRETVYGVLLVAARTGHPVTDRERTVLGELGDAIANAINAVESKQLLFADSVVELELRIADGADLFVDLTRSLGATFDLEGFVPSADGAVTCYATVSGADAAEVFAYLAAADAVRNHRGIDETGDETLLECTLEDDSVVLALLGAGANLRTLFVEEGRGHLTAEIAAGTDVRTVLEAVQSGFPETSLRAKRAVDRPVQSTGQFRRDLDEGLTERQRSVLEATYSAGYFEWPRESTAEEVSEALGLAPPTLHEHLREAERKLIGAYLDDPG
ncbi:MAG: bacterio-opsin activator domain-containing protein, partial [Halobacteriales archaeon]